MNNYKKYLDKAKKKTDDSKNSKSKQDKEFKDLYHQYHLKYSDGGQVKESQQKEYQAKDYPGKMSYGDNGPASGMSNGGPVDLKVGSQSESPSYYSKGGPVYPKGQYKDEDFSDKGLQKYKNGVLNKYADGTPDAEKGVLSYLSDKFMDAFGDEKPSPPKDQTLDDKYAKIREQNTSNASGKTSTLDQKIYNKGGMVKYADGGKITFPSEKNPDDWNYKASQGIIASRETKDDFPPKMQSMKFEDSNLKNYDDGTPDVSNQSPEEAGQAARAKRIQDLNKANMGQSLDEVEIEAAEKRRREIGRSNQDQPHYDEGTPKVPDQIDIMAKKYGWDQKTIDTIRSNKALVPPSQDPSQVSPPTPPPAMPSGVDQGINLNPDAVQNVAQAFASGGMVKQHGDMYQKFLNLYGGLPKVPKLQNPLAKVHAPAEMKVPLNIPRGAKMHFPKRLKAVGEMTGFDEGTSSVPSASMAPAPAPVSIGATPIPSPMNMQTTNTVKSLAPILKNTYAGPKKKKKMKFADGTPDVPADPSMDLGDVPVDSGPYPGEEAAAQQATDSSTQGQLQQQIDEHNQGQTILQKIDQALGKPANDEDYPQIQMPTGRKPLLPMSDEGESSDDQHDKEEVSKEDADLVNKLGKEDTEATKASDQTIDAQLAKEDSGEEKKSDAELAKDDADKQKKQDDSTEDEQDAKDEVQNKDNPAQRLRDAQDAQRKSILFNQLGKATDKMGASMGHFDAQNQGIYDENIKNADLPVKQLEEQIQMQKYDPNSDTSKSFRQYLAKFGGKDVADLGNISAADATQIAPMAFKQFEAQQAQTTATLNRNATNQERLQAAQIAADSRRDVAQERADTARMMNADRAERAAQSKEDKDKASNEKQQATVARNVDQSLYGFRQPTDVKQARMDFLNANKGLNTISAYEKLPGGTDSMDIQMVGNLRDEVQKIAQSGAPTEGGINKFDPRTWSGDLASAWQRVANKPSGANAGAFIKKYKDYFSTMQETTGGLVNSYNQSILQNNKKHMDPDDYDQRVNSEYVAPYNKYSKNKTPNFSKSTGQPSTSKTNDIPGFDPDAFLKGIK